MSFFEEVLSIYSGITFPEKYSDLSKIDKAINWYLADNKQQYITTTETNNNYILELDIKSAFFTICNAWFDQNSKFIQKLNSIPEKKSRNIFIAVSLKDTEYLKQLNMICKMIIFGIIFENSDPQILELKKDGAIIVCNEENKNNFENLSDSNNPLTKFIIEKKIEVKVDFFTKYIRSNKTSYFWNNKELITKGLYKHIPLKLKEIQQKIFSNEEIDFKKILKIYSSDYFKIIYLNNLRDIINDYYLCTNEKYLNIENKYEIKLNRETIEPKNYIKTFIYPLLLSTKL